MKSSNTSERLKNIMSNRNIKQVDILDMAAPFCKEYGVKLNKNDLSQYVNGKVEPGQNKLKILGLALNVNEAWLMGYDVPMTPPNRTSWRIHPNLNGGFPYLSWTERELIEDSVKREQAKEFVEIIPCFNMDDVNHSSSNPIFSSPVNYLPIIKDCFLSKTCIYVICNTKYQDYKGNMYPLIEENDMILLDTGLPPENGDLTMIEFTPGKNFFCRYYKYDDFIEFQFVSHKPIRVQNDSEDYMRYNVRGIVKQIIKDIE